MSQKMSKEQAREILINEGCAWCVIGTYKNNSLTPLIVWGGKVTQDQAGDVLRTFSGRYDTAKLYTDKKPRLMRDSYRVEPYDHYDRNHNALEYLRALIPVGSGVYVIKAGEYNRADQNFSNSLVRVFVVRNNELVELTHLISNLYLKREGLLLVESGCYPESEAARVIGEIVHRDGKAIHHKAPAW